MIGKCGHRGASHEYQNCPRCAKHRSPLPWTGPMTARELAQARRYYQLGELNERRKHAKKATGA